MARVTVELPDALASKARAAGILASAKVAELIREELRRREAAKELGEVMNRLQAVTDADDPKTEEEQRRFVNEVIAEVRAEARARQDAPRS